MISSIISAHHDKMAHCGVRKTLEEIKQQYWFPNMGKKIYDYVENCITCLTANSSFNSTEGKTQLFPLPEKPMQTLHADHFGPLQEAKNHYKHILVIVDAFTLFTWLFATKSTTANETIKCMRTIFNTFGNPCKIITNRGTAFTAKEFESFISELKIKHRKVAIAAPWANGLVERINRFLKSSLTKLIDSPSEWTKNQGEMQYIINTHHSVIKTSPSQLMLGYHQRKC